MDFIDTNIQEYAEERSQSGGPVLEELERETRAQVHKPQMLSGHLQGRILSLFSKMIAPRTIVEIGTYTGYSAICLAEGLRSGGKVHTIDPDEGLAEMVHRYMKKAGMEDRIDLHIGRAQEIIPTIAGPYDMVFIDADKKHYTRYFDQVIEEMAPGGLIIADNVLWKGQVLNPPPEQDENAKALDAYNEKVRGDERVEQVLFPVRDGLNVARKTAEGQ